ncbi:MAG TPA: PIN domain-containing protein [Verrucomicrobiae bacterium]
MAAKIIVDTGPLVALFIVPDENHPWALEVFGSLRTPFYTTEAVITEAAYFLNEAGMAVQPLLRRLENGVLKIPFQLTEEAGVISNLMDKYGKQMDLADATLVRLSELIDNCQILTTDYKDFSIYRRHGRQVIPLLTPPN